MRHLFLLILLPVLALSVSGKILAHEPTDEVCLIIDVGDTNPGKYPNIATEFEDFQNSINVHDQELACFDLSKKYYMQYFLLETQTYVLYGTKCFYAPKAEDEGKTLVFDGENGSSPCPVVETPPLR